MNITGSGLEIMPVCWREGRFEFLHPTIKPLISSMVRLKKGSLTRVLKVLKNILMNARKQKNLKIHVVIIPTERNVFLSHLADGLGDIAIGNLTMTDEHLKMVDFSDPFLTGVKEVVVTEKNVSDIKNSFDLAGKEIYVRKESSYYESLLTLNDALLSDGKNQ